MKLKNQLRASLRHQILNFWGCLSTPAAGIHILNGHVIARESPHPDIFERQLTQLGKSVKFIRFEDAVQKIIKKENPSEPLVAFSFDDGFEECATMIAPVLEKFGINAAFFINPNFASGNEKYINWFVTKATDTPGKKPMRWDTIEGLANRGHIIGAHTLDHYMINDDNTSELERQIGECKLVIEEKLKKPCSHFAFPYGKLEHANPLSIDIACKHYPFVFSQSDYKNYFSYDGKVINRRHFEPNWPVGHVKYFLSCKKKFS